MASLGEIAAARQKLDAAEAAVAQNAADLADAQSDLTDLGGIGHTGPERAAVVKRIKALNTQRTKLVAVATAAAAEVERLRQENATATGPEALVAGLDGQVPVALLLVRLEICFSTDAKTLRIRIFFD